VALASKAAEELKDIIRDSYLDAEYDSKWHPAKVQLIHNKGLEAVYEGLCIMFSFIMLSF